MSPCEPDFYWDHTGRGQCRRCDLCPRGWGAMRACGPRRNSACRGCPQGTYSSILSASLACFPCSTCAEHKVALRACTRTRDTLCSDSGAPDAPDLSRAYEGPNSKAGDPKYYDQDGADHSVWPVYCALLGALVFALFLYVILKRWRFKAPGPRRHLGCRQQKILRNHNQGPEGEFFVCALKRKTLETQLNKRRNDGKDWRGLARELGYSPEQVRQLESRSRLKFENNCANGLLSDWSRRDGAAVASLHGALRRLGNADAISALLGSRCSGALCCGVQKAPQTLVCDTKTALPKGPKTFLRPPGGAFIGQPLGDIV